MGHNESKPPSTHYVVLYSWHYSIPLHNTDSVIVIHSGEALVPQWIQTRGVYQTLQSFIISFSHMRRTSEANALQLGGAPTHQAALWGLKQIFPYLWWTNKQSLMVNYYTSQRGFKITDFKETVLWSERLWCNVTAGSVKSVAGLWRKESGFIKPLCISVHLWRKSNWIDCITFVTVRSVISSSIFNVFP